MRGCIDLNGSLRTIVIIGSDSTSYHGRSEVLLRRRAKERKQKGRELSNCCEVSALEEDGLQYKLLYKRDIVARDGRTHLEEDGLQYK